MENKEERQLLKGKFKRGCDSSLNDEDQQFKNMWLVDLKKGNLSENEIVQGVLFYYVIEGLSLSDIEEDLVPFYRKGEFYIGTAMERIKSALFKVVDGEALEYDKEDVDEKKK